MASPKKDMDGTLMRYITSNGGDTNKPLSRSQSFERDGYHSKPSGGASNTKHGSKRKDFKFFKHETTEK